MQVMNIFISTQKVTMMMVKMTLSMMMSGTHSLAASSGLRTTYPRLDQNVRQNLRLEEKRNARIVFPVQSVWLLNQPHTIVLKGSQLEEEGEEMKRKPSRGKTRSSPVQSSSQLPSHRGCSCELSSQ